MPESNHTEASIFSEGLPEGVMMLRRPAIVSGGETPPMPSTAIQARALQAGGERITPDVEPPAPVVQGEARLRPTPTELSFEGPSPGPQPSPPLTTELAAAVRSLIAERSAQGTPLSRGPAEAAPPGSVFLTQVKAGGPFGDLTLAQAGIMLQEAGGKSAVAIGPKPETGPKQPSVPEKTTFDGKTDLEGLIPGIPESIPCGQEHYIVTTKPFTCDIVLWEGYECIPVDVPYSCNADAQRVSDDLFPDRISTDPAKLDALIRKVNAIGRHQPGVAVTDQELYTVEAWRMACTCVRELILKERKVMKDWDGRPIKDSTGHEVANIPARLRKEFVCAKGCVEVWDEWCGYGKFEEARDAQGQTQRWCELVLDDNGKPKVEIGSDDCLKIGAAYKHYYRIKTRITGWLRIVWRFKCVPFIETSDAKDLIDQGLLTPDGGPAGLNLPPGSPGPEAPSRKVPSNCCCVVDEVRITNIQPCKYQGYTWGHRFTVRIDYHWKPGSPSQDREAACSVQWFEWSDNFPKRYRDFYGNKNNYWVDQHRALPNAKTLKQWLDAFNKSIPDDCEEEEPAASHHAELTDTPSLGWDPEPHPDVDNRKRNLYIKIIVNGCDASKAACFHQHLYRENGERKGEAYALECKDVYAPDTQHDSRGVNDDQVGDEPQRHSRVEYTDSNSPYLCT